MACKINHLPQVLLSVFIIVFSAVEATKLAPCNFPVIFNFGDSNSDPGYDLTVDSSGKPNRPACDGRLIVDFIAEHMGKKFLNSAMPINGKLNPGATFEQGANYAVGGSTLRFINNATVGTYLDNEIHEFTLFKAGIVQGRKSGSFPKPQDFSKALYTIDIGHNDVVRSIYGRNVDEIPELIQKFAEGIKKLYGEGARSFWIHNTAPHGCFSSSFSQLPYFVNGELDGLGCLKRYNEVASEFNKQLKARIVELRDELKEAAITYVDVHSAKLKLFSDSNSLGFADRFASCKKGYTVCPDPSNYILWDGVHFTQAANQLVAQAIINGSLSDPPLPITHACYRS